MSAELEDVFGSMLVGKVSKSEAKQSLSQDNLCCKKRCISLFNVCIVKIFKDDQARY